MFPYALDLEGLQNDESRIDVVLTGFHKNVDFVDDFINSGHEVNPRRTLSEVNKTTLIIPPTSVEP
jgi:hypothetical protein